MTSLASVFVDARLDTSKFPSDLKKGVSSSSMSSAASSAGKTTGSKFSSGFKTAIAGVGTALAGAFAVSKGVDFLKGSIDEAREAQKVGAQTAAVLKSTGGAANVTAKHIGDLANAISKKAGIDDEAIQSGENLLLTFKYIRDEQGKGNKIFSQATRLATDLGVAMGKTTKGAALQLGKALNDPVKGLGALSRSGITFNAQQTAQIKTMVAHNNVLGAQKVMLKEVASEVGGSAAAQATAGDKLRVTFANLQESIGTALLPVLDALATWLSDVGVPALYTFAGFVRSDVLPLLQQWGQWLQTYVLPALQAITTVLLSTLVPALSTVAGFLAHHMDLLQDLAIIVGIAGAAWVTYNAIQLALKVPMMITTAATWAQTAAVTALNAVLDANPIMLIIIALGALVAAFVLAYKHSETFRKIVDATWSAIKDAVVVFWQYVKPVLQAFWGFINNYLIPIIKFYYEHVIKLYFKLIVLYIKGWWALVKGIFAALKFYFEHVLFPIFKFLWHNVVQPIFGGIRDTIGAVWRTGIKPIFDAMVTFVGKTLPNAFEDGVHAMSRAWKWLENLLKNPINWVITNVLNDGLIAAINWLAHKLGGSEHLIGDVATIKAATGGVLPGWSPGSDNHRFFSPTAGMLELSGGEAVMRPEWTRMVGGARAVNEMNRQARHGNLVMGHGMAQGGVWRPIANAPITQGLHDEYTGFPALDFGHLPGAPVAAVAPGRVVRSEDLISGGRFVSYGRVMQVLHQGFETLYAHLSKRGLPVGAQVGGGQIIGLSGNVGNVIGSGHLHFGSQGRSPWDFANGSTFYSYGSGQAAGQGVIGQALGGLSRWVSLAQNPLKWLEDKVAASWSGAGSWVNSPYGQMLKSVPGALYDVGVNKLKSLAGSLTGLTTQGSVSSGWTAQIAQALKLLGQPMSLIPLVLSRLMRESSGNPGIVNTWDSNWQAGTPSVGLMQVIGPTFRAYAGAFRNTGPFKYGVSTNPLANIYAALNYALHRYGSIEAAMTQAGGYDNGGLAVGKGLMPKNTIRPEMVLSPATTVGFLRLVDALTTQSRGDRRQRIVLTVSGQHDFEAYVEEIASDSIHQDAGYASTLARGTR